MLCHLVVCVVRCAGTESAAHVYVADLHAVDVASVDPSKTVYIISPLFVYYLSQKLIGQERQ